MPIVQREAGLKLDFIIVGGSLSGLAAAYTLGCAGHRVRVLEKYDYRHHGGGIRVPPNLSKILKQWVGQEKLAELTTLCARSHLFRLETGQCLGYLQWTPAVMKEAGGDFLLMHYDDLTGLLLDLAKRAGASISLNSPVASVRQGTPSSPRPSVTLSTGEVLSADVVIGADGCRSVAREVILGKPSQVRPGGLTLYDSVLDPEDILGDAEISALLEDYKDEWHAWVSTHKSILGHAVVRATHGRARPSQHSGKGYWFGLYCLDDNDVLPHGGGETGTWGEPYSLEKDLTSLDPPILHRLVSKASAVTRVEWLRHEDEGNDWFDSTRRIVLMGDAAHPSIPSGIHGASMAVEDAVVFGSLFSHLQSVDQICPFVNAFQEIRQTRTYKVRASEIDNIRMMCLPEGPARDARDAILAKNMHGEELTENGLKDQFEECKEHFGYDAGDVAEEWWVNWGRFLLDSPPRRMTQVDVAKSVLSA